MKLSNYVDSTAKSTHNHTYIEEREILTGKRAANAKPLYNTANLKYEMKFRVDLFFWSIDEVKICGAPFEFDAKQFVWKFSLEITHS